MFNNREIKPSRRNLRYFGTALFLILLRITTPILAAESEIVEIEQFNPESPIQGSGWANIYSPTSNSTQLLPYLIIDNMAIYQGDMILGPAAGFEPFTTPANTPIQQGVATQSLGRRWDDGIVYYDLNGHAQSAAILDAIAYLEDNTSIRFLARTNQADYVRFGSSNGCSSFIGRIGGAQNISIGFGCQSLGVVSHEIFHALGVFHEQSRSDRNSFITVNFGNISTGFEGNFDIAGNSIDIGSYDYDSIMHYSTHAFSNNGLPTITTIPPGISIGNRSTLSDGDIETMQFLYYTDLQLDLSTVSQVNAGASVQLTIDIANRGDTIIGDIIAKDVKVSLPLPMQSSYVGFSSTDSWSCAQVSQMIECDIAILERNADSTITIDLTAPSTLSNMVINPVVSASNRDIQTANDSDSATITILNLTDMSVDISTSESSVNVGDSVTVNLSLNNSGQADAQQVSLILTTPAQMQFTDFTGTDWNCSNSANTTSCIISSLAVAASSSLAIKFEAVAATANANITAAVSTQNTDGDLSNNNRTTTIDLVNFTDLGITMSASNTGITAGSNVAIDIALSNNSPQAVGNIIVNITAPSNYLEYIEATGSGWICTRSGSTILCGLNSLASSVLSQLVVNFKALKENNAVDISAAVSTQITDINSANNSASTSLKINAVSTTSTSSSSSGSGSFGLLMLILTSIFACFRVFKYNRSF